MKIYNSLTGRKEELSLLQEGKVKIYVCGMTVYDDCHLGHARTFLSFDMIVRYLKFKNLEVEYVRNITDVDDNILERAKELSEEPLALTKRYISRMHSDFQALGMIVPDKEPKATENIKVIIELISVLIEKGHAYYEGQDVYFAVDSYKDYGKLSNQRMEEILSGSRIEIDKHKRNPADFVLWKKSREGLFWDSPWGEGRPGWHIECSAMSMNSLGKNFDIHAGGIDLKFPHHENEIAQSETSSGTKFANYWMHTGPLRIDQEKMSKSLGNFLTIREALKNFSSEVLRYFLLSSHYRSPINFSVEGLNEAKSALDRLYNSTLDLNIKSKKDIGSTEYTKNFKKAMDDDFNAPKALAVLFDMAKNINRLKKEREFTKSVLLAGELISLAGPLGIIQQDPKIFLREGVDLKEKEIEDQIKEREEARQKGDYSSADMIRKNLLEENIILEDSKEGTFWRRR